MIIYMSPPKRMPPTTTPHSPLQNKEEDAEVRSPSHNHECCDSNGSSAAEFSSMMDKKLRGTQISRTVLITA